ncbi:hypothetical protein C8R43DRAFT_994205 [Mycena crocata]|nr:hypothetical protein C8R43DRAFT_994205 [Mycena crocata]
MTSTEGSTSGGIGSKIKGATQVVHGIGENVRGTLLGGVDTVVHKKPTVNDEIAAKGRAEQAQGVAKIEAAHRGANPTGAHGGTHPGGGLGTSPNVPNPGDAPPPSATYGAGAHPGGHVGTNQPTMHTGTDPALSLNQQPGYVPASSTQPAPHDHHGHGAAYAPYQENSAVAQNIPNYDGPGNAPHQQNLARHDRPPGEPQHHRDDAISGGNPGMTGGTGVDAMSGGAGPDAMSAGGPGDPGPVAGNPGPSATAGGGGLPGNSDPTSGVHREQDMPGGPDNINVAAGRETRQGMPVNFVDRERGVPPHHSDSLPPAYAEHAGGPPADVGAQQRGAPGEEVL